MKVVVLGANGFIGSHLVEHLRECGHSVIERKGWEYDLRSPWEAHRALDVVGLDVVVNCAGWNRNVRYSRENAPRIYRDNTLIGLNALDAAASKGAGRVVSLVASCGYSGDREHMEGQDYLRWAPHESVAAHGEAKRNLMRASNFHREKGLDSVCLCPPTVMGPRDHVAPERTKFTMAMVARMVEARRQGAPSVTCWGDGSAMREVLYVGDLVRLIEGFVAGKKEWGCPFPFNLPSGQEPSIWRFAHLTAELAGYRGKILWDGSDNGAKRKKLVNEDFGFFFPDFSFTPLEEALFNTIEWYKSR